MSRSHLRMASTSPMRVAVRTRTELVFSRSPLSRCSPNQCELLVRECLRDLLGLLHPRGLFDRIAWDDVAAHCEAHHHAQDCSRVLHSRVGLRTLDFEETLDATDCDLAHGEVFEGRHHQGAQLSLVGLFRAVGEVRVHEHVLPPCSGEVAEGGGCGHGSISRLLLALGEPRLQLRAGSAPTVSGSADLPSFTVPIAEPRRGAEPARSNLPDQDLAKRPDRRARPPRHHRSPPAIAGGASGSCRPSSHRFTSETRKRSSRPTRTPFGPRSCSRRS